MSFRTFFRLCGALALVCLGLTEVQARVAPRTVAYRQEGAVLRGFLACDEPLKGKRPGVVSFHSGLPRPWSGELKRLKARILLLHGADDPLVPAADLTNFEQAMRQAGADWQMVFFGGGVHSFTNPAAGANRASGAAYDARAARRSWRDMQEFFRDIWRVKGQD